MVKKEPRCANCRYWTRNPHVKAPANCYPRERSFLGFRWVERPTPRNRIVAEWAEAMACRGDCSRYPKAVTTNEGYACAEHKPVLKEE